MVDSSINAHQEARKLYADRFAPDFSIFDFIDADEMKLSTILAWLLSPSGSHGQRSLFLDLLIEQLGLRPAADVQVATEFSTQSGRFDVILSAPDWRIVIENKPWAGEQPDQIARYVAHLERSIETWKIIYLTPKGTPPASLDERDLAARMHAGQVLTWAYQSEIVAWLEACAGKCNAERVATFIKDFLRYIRATFQGMKDMAMSDHLVEQIVGNSSYTRAALHVCLIGDQLRMKLLDQLVQGVQGQMPEWQVSSDLRFGRRWCRIGVGPFAGSPYQFVLEFESANLARLAFGFAVADAQGKIAREDFRVPTQDQSDAIVRMLGSGDGGPPIDEVVPNGWLWWRRANPADSLLSTDYNWNVAVEPWVEIADGRMVRKLIAAARQIFQTMRDTGLIRNLPGSASADC